MGILKQRLLPSLPKSSKTFLQNEIENGIRESVIEKLHQQKIVELIVHFDGLPVTKSGTEDFWPILGKIFSDKHVYKPFPIAVFHGKGKPNDREEYLSFFMEELNNLQRDDITFHNSLFIILLSFVFTQKL